MLYTEIIAVWSQIHTKHINTPCEQNIQLLNINLPVYIVTICIYIYICSVHAVCVVLCSAGRHIAMFQLQTADYC